MKILRMYRDMGQRLPTFSPSLNLGDVLIFSKCTVHTCSGDNSLRLPRQAWQLRFFSEPQVSISNRKYLQKLLSFQLFVRGLNKAYPGMGSKYMNRGDDISGPKYPRLWPRTVPDEDEIRRQGHMTLTRIGWYTNIICYLEQCLCILCCRMGHAYVEISKTSIGNLLR